MMEQTKERRKLGLAILISLFLHLVVGFSLAAFGSAFTPALPLEDKPVELTIVDLSATPPPLVPKNPPFMETAPSKESAEKPKEQTFESNANSIAASKLPATGDAPLPTQDGKERPVVNLETHDYSLPTDGSKPQPEPQSTVAPESKPAPEATTPPKPKASEAPISTPTAAPVTTPEPEQFAMLKSTPPPPIKAPDETEPSPPPGCRSVSATSGPEAETRTGRFQLSGAKRANSHYRPPDKSRPFLSERGRNAARAIPKSCFRCDRFALVLLHEFENGPGQHRDGAHRGGGGCARPRAKIAGRLEQCERSFR